MVSTARQNRSHVREREKAGRLSHNSSRDATLPQHNGHVNGRSKRKGPKIKAAGESGRSGIDPLHFFRIVWRSSSYLSKLVNILWPFVPAAIVVFWVVPEHNILKFALAYLAMIPSANLVGFAGQELARKMPHILGVVTETTLGAIVEIVLFLLLLIAQNQIYVIQAAILGSILATMLLCLGLCFFAGGLRREENVFDEAVSEAGSGLLLTAGMGLAIPTIFDRSLSQLPTEDLAQKTLGISRAVAVLFIIAHFVYLWYQTRTHHGIYNAIFEEDEARDTDGGKDQRKAKLTLTECILALVVSIALVVVIAWILVHQIEPLHEETGISDPFIGLILVPLVEKAGEHLTAIDEAWDNQMNFALSHVLGSTLQTALFNGPLVVIVGWCLNREMSLLFEVFDIAVLLLAIITVGNFLRDQKSNYLEGFLCVIVYIAIAVAAFYYEKPTTASSGETAQ